jgi:hypothetical protein
VDASGAGCPHRLLDGIKLTYAGNFFNFAMPGSNGGDIFKAYMSPNIRGTRWRPSRPSADRIVGLTGIVCLRRRPRRFAWMNRGFAA